jgi:hypothetical protein
MHMNKVLFEQHYEQARKTKALIGGFRNSLFRHT